MVSAARIKVQIEANHGRNDNWIINCTREPIIHMQGGGALVLECVGSAIRNGMFNGEHSPKNPYFLDVTRIMAIRRFE